MAVDFRILPEVGLVYIRYSGLMLVEESGRALASYLQNPDYRPGQKQLVDLSDVEEWERDFPKLMALQARKAEAFYKPEAPTLIAAIAPNAKARQVADFISRTWDAFENVAYLVSETEHQALELLGVPARSVADLLAPR